ARQTTGSDRRLRSTIRIPESYPPKGPETPDQNPKKKEHDCYFRAPPLSLEMLWNGLACCQAAFLPIVPATKAVSSKCGCDAQSHPAASRLRITSNENRADGSLRDRRDGREGE